LALHGRELARFSQLLATFCAASVPPFTPAILARRARARTATNLPEHSYVMMQAVRLNEVGPLAPANWPSGRSASCRPDSSRRISFLAIQAKLVNLGAHGPNG